MLESLEISADVFDQLMAVSERLDVTVEPSSVYEDGSWWCQECNAQCGSCSHGCGDGCTSQNHG
jgi:hypothetical protein